jgi:uncharacterized protein YbjT (DUF2867 family)
LAANDKILVSGASGNVGGSLLEYLAAAEVEVRALTHDESKASALKGKGMEAFVGDLARPETLGEAFEGVDRVFHLTPNSPEGATLGANLIDAAKESGNEVRVVRLSTLKASREGPSRLSKQHAEVEDALTSSGLPYTILRPVYYMQNTMAVARNVASEGKIYQPLGDGRIGMIDTRDIAEVAAKVLTEEGHEGKTYTLTGPASISYYDVAAALSEALDKEVVYVEVPLDAARGAMVGEGFPEWLADAVIEWAEAFREGYGDFTTEDVERLTGHPATSYEKFAGNFAQVFGGE